MAYSTSNPPALVSQGVGGNFRQWVYQSEDASSVVQVNGYFSNAGDLGMQAGDIVIVIDTNASPIAAQLMIVSAINSNGSADLSSGVAVTATNSD